MDFFGNPFDLLGTLGPPTRFQPQWAGSGYKHFIFDSSPVGHVIAPDGSHHQAVNVHPNEAHLPVEHELLGYIKETGYDVAEMRLPEHDMAWDHLSQQFGFPDSRPGSSGQALPADTTANASGDVNPLTGRFPNRRERRQFHADLPYHPDFFSFLRGPR